MANLFAIAVVGVAAADDMVQVVAERLARLDHLRIEYLREYYNAPLNASALDRSQWQAFDGDVDRHQNRLTIVRPGALHEFLTDLPEAGYEPLQESTFGGRYVSRYTRPTSEGRAYYTVAGTPHLGTFWWLPVLQVFDLYIQDSDTPDLNILALLQREDVRLLRSVAGVSTYAVSVPMWDGAMTQHFEFDLNHQGTCLRLKAILESRAGLTTREQYVLSVAQVNGAELPTEAVVIVHNPRAADYFGIDYIVVTSWSVCADLTPEAIRIEPERRNSVVVEQRPDHVTVHTTYDKNGAVIGRQETFGPAPADEAGDTAWRLALPPAAAGTGIAVVLGLNFGARRSRGQQTASSA